MKITLKQIEDNEIKRTMWMEGFQHGNIGIPKQLPSYEKESYELGYKYGREGKVQEYIKMVKIGDKNIKVKKATTRSKK